MDAAAAGRMVLACVAVVVLEAFNPQTLNLLKVGAGFSEQLQCVPFFFFGWLLVRSKARLRRMYPAVGVIALANGMVATYQTRLGPASGGQPGAKATPEIEGKAARVYKSEGDGHVRPTGLGDESGAGGGTGLDRDRWACWRCLARAQTKTWLLAAAVVRRARGDRDRPRAAAGRRRRARGDRLRAAHRQRRSPGSTAAALLIVTSGGGASVSADLRVLGSEKESSRAIRASPRAAAPRATSYKEDELKQIPKEIAVVAVRVRSRDGGPGRRASAGKSTEDVRRPQRQRRDDLQLHLQGSRAAGPDRLARRSSSRYCCSRFAGCA